jgi:hypothetical protein
MTTTTELTHKQLIQDNVARLAIARGMTLEEVAEKAGEPLSAFMGPRLYLRSIERAARVLKAPVDQVFGFGDCQPWCSKHEDDGDSDYCCHRVGEWTEGLPVEIWHDARGTRINIEHRSRGDEFTPAEARKVIELFSEAVFILDEFEAH